MTLLESYKQHFQSVKSRELRVAAHCRVTSLCWSCDGKNLAVASTDGIVRIWSSFTPHSVPLEIAVNDHQSSKHFLIAYHPKQPNILACCCMNSVDIINATAGTTTATRKMSSHAIPEPAISLTWSTEGAMLLIGTKTDHLLLFSYSGSDDSSLTQTCTFACDFEANQCAFSRADDRILVASSPGSLVAIAILDGGRQLSIVASIRCASASAYSIALSPSFLVVGAADATMTIFAASANNSEGGSVDSPEPVSCISRSDGPVKHVSLSYDGMFVASVGSGGDDRRIDVAVVPGGECVHGVQVEGAVSSLCWHPDSYLLTYSCDTFDKNGRSEYVVHVFGFTL